MRLTIFARFALSIIIAAGAAILLALSLMRSGFEAGFLDYVNDAESERLSRQARFLADEYRRHGNWYFVNEDLEFWSLMVTQIPQQPPPRRRENRGGPGGRPPPPDRSPPPNSAPPDRQRPPPPPSGFAPPEGDRPPPRPPPRSAVPALQNSPTTESIPISLLDRNRAVLIGEAVSTDVVEVRIVVRGETVGYLQSAVHNTLRRQADRDFVERQGARIAIIALIATGILLLAALISARQITGPVRRLSNHLDELSQGNFEARINRSGSNEIGDLEDGVNQLANALEQNRSARQRWLASISHELRTPLSILQGEIEVLQEGLRPLDEHALASLADEAARLGRLVNDLSELTLSDVGALTYRMAPLEISEVISGAVAACQRRAVEQDLEVTLTSIAAAEISGDKDRLRQLLDNLLENAVRYSDRGGRIEVSGERQRDGGYLVTVDDSPPAVDEANMARLFEPLYRTDDARSRKTGGAGLGLAICHNIVSAHGGRIQASASPLGGLQITVSLS